MRILCNINYETLCGGQLKYIFTHVPPTGGGCNDLIFSGHMVMATLVRKLKCCPIEYLSNPPTTSLAAVFSRYLRNAGFSGWLGDSIGTSL